MSQEFSSDYAHQCAAWTTERLGRYRKQCGLPVVHDINGWIYLCPRHYGIIFREFERDIENLNSRRVSNMQERMEEMQARIDRHGPVDDEPVDFSIEAYEARRTAQTVYFMRCEQYIKIGISHDPAVRLLRIKSSGGSLIPKRMDFTQAAIIATEHGGFDREQALHAKFAHLRHTGEWFTESPELTAYIDSLATA